jgi:hypothetical protein
VLVWLVLGEIKLGLGEYLRRVARIPLWAAVAGAAGLTARAAAAGASGGVRLGVVATATLGVFFALLAAFEGISPWSIARAVRGEKPPAG